MVVGCLVSFWLGGVEGGEQLVQQHRGVGDADAIHEQFQNQTQVARQKCEQRNISLYITKFGTTTPSLSLLFFVILNSNITHQGKKKKVKLPNRIEKEDTHIYLYFSLSKFTYRKNSLGFISSYSFFFCVYWHQKQRSLFNDLWPTFSSFSLHRSIYWTITSFSVTYTKQIVPSFHHTYEILKKKLQIPHQLLLYLGYYYLHKIGT